MPDLPGPPSRYEPPTITDYGGLRELTAVTHPLLAGAGAHGGMAQDMSFSGSSSPPPSYGGGQSGTGAAHAHGHAAHHHATHHAHHRRPSRRAHKPRRHHGFTG